MKLLFDQNISPKILKLLSEYTLDCQQVRFVDLENAADMQIFQFAKANYFSIVTFDLGFIDLNGLYGTPPKIIYLNTGNMTTKRISELITDNILKIKYYLDSDSDEILELIKLP